MRLTKLTLLAAAAFTVAGCAQAKDAVRFQAHDVTEYRGGYAVEVFDFNNDGLLDVVPNSTGNPTLMWYENPTWEPHVIVSDTRGIVNKAMGDLDGDGIPEVAIQSSFAMVAANSDGLNWVARSGGNPEGEWQAEVIDRWATSHHVVFADLDGDGALELVNAPLIGSFQSMLMKTESDLFSVILILNFSTM